MSRLKCVAMAVVTATVVLGSGARGGAQEFRVLGNGLRLQQVPVADCGSVAFAVLVEAGFDHDPLGASGLADAAAQYLLMAAAAELPPRVLAGYQVLDDATVFHCRVSAVDAANGWRWCRALLAPLGPVDPDRAAIALARAALEADDAAMVYPGPMLRSRLRQALLAGTPGGRNEAGAAREVQARTAEELAAWIDAVHGPRTALVAAVGNGDATADAAALGALPPRGARPDPVPRPGPATGLFSTHSRVDGPFLAAAFPAPATTDAEGAAFALGLQILGSRAARAFRQPRGGEIRARAPFVTWSPMAGEPLVVLCRRGDDGAPADQPRAELEEVLADLRWRPPSAAEMDFARRTLLSQCLRPPYPPDWQRILVERPEILVAMARNVVQGERRGWPRDLSVVVESIDAAQVAAVLRRAVAPDRVAFAGLLPLSGPSR